ncbi:MAG: four helix bundle protein [Bacteroidetes bacterium]|nr:four helix bundle protein [Bacteroidota bacterium]
MKSHKDLTVYQEGMNLVEDIYRITKMLPDEEKFGLVSQMRRAAVSIVSNTCPVKSLK